uniref:Zinc metalloproteinase n=1 Tax=Panagrolaimus sp. PS1159 TaxID=55785 RepID=A0AC35FT55_9BILA
MPGLEPMSSDKHPHFSVIETVSKTKPHRHRRQVIAGPIYEWQSNDIPYQIWGGDANFQNLIRRGIRMWEESTCLRFRENMQSRDAIRYVLERGDSCFTEYIGRNGGFQDIIIGSECAEVCTRLNFLFQSCFFFH